MQQSDSGLQEGEVAKRNISNCLGQIVGGMIVVAICAYYVFFKDVDDKKPPKLPKRAESSEDWHKAENRKEFVLRIKQRLEHDLQDIGLNPTNLLANAKAHPTQLVRPVPEHPGHIGRIRLLVLSDEDEVKIARSYVEQCRGKGLLSDDDIAGLARVRRIAARLVPVIPQITGEPEVHLFRDNSVNACCLPDGTVFVNTGTLQSISDDDLLAAILAHELGHAAARHGNEGVTRALKVAVGGVAAEELMANLSQALDSDTGVSIVRVLYGIGSNAIYTRPRDRRMEDEADRLGTRYLARAGYNPEAMIRLLEWFQQVSPEDADKRNFENLFRSHPFHTERLERVREVLQEPDIGKPLGPTVGERIKPWRDKAAGIVSNAVERMPQSGSSTNRKLRLSGWRKKVEEQ